MKEALKAALIASPLTRLLKNYVSFIWHNAQQNSFDQLKYAFTNAPVLAFPDYSLPFTFFTDASALGIGAFLMQQTESSCPQVIAYASRTLNGAESLFSYSSRGSGTV